MSLSSHANSKVNVMAADDFGLLRVIIDNSKLDINDAFSTMYAVHGSQDNAPNINDALSNPDVMSAIHGAGQAIRKGMIDVGLVLEAKGGGNKPSGYNIKEAVEITDFYAGCSRHYEQISEYLDKGNFNDLYDNLEMMAINRIVDNVRLKDLHDYALALKDINHENWSDEMKMDALRSFEDAQGHSLVSVFYQIPDDKISNGPDFD